jgi:competence protein ComFC
MVRTDSQFVSKSSTDLCLDCERGESQEINFLNKNRSVYLYNDFMKEMIARFKFRGDAELAHGFRFPMLEIYRKHFRSYLIVPIPLSEERLKERCFNQAQLLAEQLPGKVVPVLVRPVHSSKQSKKSRRERLSMTENPFMINPQFNKPVNGEKILLIDDIYTTGTTVRQAANALQALNPELVCSLTLARAD